MACVTVTNVTVLDNPARFENPFQVTAPLLPAASPRTRTRGLQHSAPPPPPPTLSPSTLAAGPTMNRRVPPAQFEIEFECIAPIPDDIEWKLTCVAPPPCLPASLHPWPPLTSMPAARPHHASTVPPTWLASPRQANPALTPP
eukprot:scaffold121832_cov63-Phaeocystis_antarctica.AAC.1